MAALASPGLRGTGSVRSVTCTCRRSDPVTDESSGTSPKTSDGKGGTAGSAAHDLGEARGLGVDGLWAVAGQQAPVFIPHDLRC